METTLQVHALTKTFDTITAVNNISFSAHQGEIIALLGPNGAGKSTLMNMITGFLAPTSGKIKVLGKNIDSDPIAAKAAIGFLPEGSPLYADMTVGQFLTYMAELKGLTKNILPEIAKQAKIENVFDQKVETLSKGYQRRVGFAQSILANPPILLLDEPTDGLDPNQKDHIRDIISAMGQQKTILISTHLLEEAESIATRIILINRGKIMADGTLESILKTTKTKTLDQAFKKLTKE